MTSLIEFFTKQALLCIEKYGEAPHTILLNNYLFDKALMETFRYQLIDLLKREGLDKIKTIKIPLPTSELILERFE